MTVAQPQHSVASEKHGKKENTQHPKINASKGDAVDGHPPGKNGYPAMSCQTTGLGKKHKKNKLNDFDASGHRREVDISLTSEKRQRRRDSKKTLRC